MTDSLVAHALRLKSGQDLKKEILAFCQTKSILAGCIVSSVGSLSQVHLRLAYSQNFLFKIEHYEILSLNGTVSKNGLHLHMSVADKTGATVGGHVIDNNLIYTTCELIILELSNYIFSRELDPQTKFNELVTAKK